MSIEISVFKSNEIRELNKLNELLSQKEHLYFCNFRQFYFFTKNNSMNIVSEYIHLIDVTQLRNSLITKKITNQDGEIIIDNIELTEINFGLGENSLFFNEDIYLKFKNFIDFLFHCYDENIKYIYVEYDY